MSGRIPEPVLATSEVEWRTVDGAGFRLHVPTAGEDGSFFARSVQRSLADSPRWLHCRWLYDEFGSEIYERITEQPEYYLTRVEDRILADNAARIRSLVGDVTLAELGSGSSSKTRHMIEAWLAEGDARYTPIDISRSAIEAACQDLSVAYPGLTLEGIAGRYVQALPLIGSLSPLLLLFLGSTIGNFDDGSLDEFLDLVAQALNPGDHFLLGMDLLKDAAILNAAYNDAAGFTERFMINVVERMNRELGTAIPLAGVRYEGAYNEQLERVEMYLRFVDDVNFRVAGAADEITIGAGERVFMESSRKFRVDDMIVKLRDFGFVMRECFTDVDELFAVLLLKRV